MRFHNIAALVVLLFAGVASAGVLIVGKQSGRCLDVHYGDTHPDTQVWLWHCDFDNRNQAFNAFNASNSELHLSAAPTKCLNVDGQPKQGTPVDISACSGSANQKWAVPTGTGPINLLSYTGLCLDVYGQRTADRSYIIVAACNGEADQQWTLKPL